MKGKVVSVVDSKTDQVHRYVDNGLFLDGRAKTLKKCGLNPTGRTPWKRRKHTRNEGKTGGNRNVTEFLRHKNLTTTRTMNRPQTITRFRAKLNHSQAAAFKKVMQDLAVEMHSFCQINRQEFIVTFEDETMTLPNAQDFYPRASWVPCAQSEGRH